MANAICMNSCIGEQERSKINHLCFHLKKIGKETNLSLKKEKKTKIKNERGNQ